MEKRWIVAFLFIGIFAALMIFSSFFYYNENSFTGLTIFKSFISLPANVINSGLVFLDIVFVINIQSPENTTYNFELNTSYPVSLNVSSNRDVIEWHYTLKDLKNGNIVNNTVSFTPNITIYAVRESNELIVEAVDAKGKRKNESVIFYINVSNSAPEIINLSDNLYVCEDNYLSKFFNVTDIDGDTLAGNFFPSDPFYLGYRYEVNETVWTYELFSGTLSKSQAGGNHAGSETYEETLSFNDGENAASQQINITGIEINHAPVVEDIGAQTVSYIGDNTTFYHKFFVNDSEDGDQDSGNLTFNISFLPNINLFNISLNGTMSYASNLSQLGIYNVTVCAIDKGLLNPHANISLCLQDGGNLSSCDNFNITVTNENRPPVITSYYPTNLTLIVYEGDTLFFNLTSYDPDRTTPDTYWYLDYVLNFYAPESNVSSFSHTFDYASAGKHNVIGRVTDGLLNDSILWNITVIDVPYVCGDDVCDGNETCLSCPADCGICSSPSGGGGGGGGCKEKWGCKEWEDCRNLTAAFLAGQVNFTFYQNVLDNCTRNGYEFSCGFQAKICNDVKFCGTNFSKPKSIRECFYTVKPNCTDGIQNCHDGSCEILTDCGGPCSPCPTCTDGIKNQEEEGIDCGGPCQLCIEMPVIPGLIYRLFAIFEKNVMYILAIFFSILAFLVVMILLRRYIKLRKNIKKIKQRNYSNAKRNA